MPSYPLPTLAAQITDAGISAPPFADILASLKATYAGIYGSDAYLEPDSQDGQWIAAIASAVNDCNAATIAAYNARSPSSAQGNGLSSVVKINGLKRKVPSVSFAALTLVGQAYTTIQNGKAQDEAGNTWSLPSLVTIPVEGEIVVGADCDVLGAISAGIGTINQINTPTLGWQTVTNVAAATPGAPVEQDANLRRRQASSTALPAQTPLQAIVGAVLALSGVSLVKPYENDAETTDANGLPAHSISLVVEGGADADVASQILAKKTPGGPTYGNTAVSVMDAFGLPRTVRFSRPALIDVKAQITLHPLAGYSSVIEDSVAQAVLDYINGLDIGVSVYRTRLYLPANLFGGAGSETFEVTDLQIGLVGGSLGTGDIAIAYDQLAQITSNHLVMLTA